MVKQRKWHGLTFQTMARRSDGEITVLRTIAAGNDPLEVTGDGRYPTGVRLKLTRLLCYWCCIDVAGGDYVLSAKGAAFLAWLDSGPPHFRALE